MSNRTSNPDPPPPRGPGRPRSEAARRAILAAAFALLGERGYEGTSIEAVAARAGVGKATVYRGWPGRAELATDAFFAATDEELKFPNTGSAREDFRRQIRTLARLLRTPVGGAMAAMASGARSDAALGHAVAQRWVAPRREWGRKRLRRAVADGECVAGLDVDAALEVLYAPVYARLLFGRPLPTAAEVDALLAVAFGGIFTGGNGTGAG